jgi:hypothetical protein
MKAAAALDRARRMGQRSSMADDSPPEDDKNDIPPIDAEGKPLPEDVGKDDRAMDEGDEEEDGPLTSGDYHSIAQKQILNAVFAVLAETKMDWGLIAPFLEAAREVCMGDIEETAQIRLHVMRHDGANWIEAEEAFLGISVSDRDDGKEWLSETYWISDIATADDDPEKARAVVHGLERSIARINAWLADKPGGAAVTAPPAKKSRAKKAS